MSITRGRARPTAGQLDSVTSLSPADLHGWLEDLIYTARETLRELRVMPPLDT